MPKIKAPSVPSSITTTANNSTNETVYPVFVDGATGTQGIETDTGLTYNPSNGNLTAGTFVSTGLSTITQSGSIDDSYKNKTILLAASSPSDTTVTVTLPAAIGSHDTYKFLVSVAAAKDDGSAGYVIQRTGDDKIHGQVYVTDNSDGSLLHIRAIAKHSLSLDGSYTGGIIGDYIEFYDYATDKWHLKHCHLSAAAETSASSPLNE